jgi:hypothetical protein
MAAGVKSNNVVPVTVVVVALDATSTLPAVLAALRGQTAQPAEMVVVDRGSSDGTVALLTAWQPPSSMVFSVIEAVGASVSEARNVAIEAAAFDAILLTDASAIPDLDWVRNLSAALDSGAEMVGGRVRMVGASTLESAVALARTSEPTGFADDTFVPSGVDMAFTAATWDAVGGFPEWLDAGEDAVFAEAIRDSGALISYAPDAVTAWRPRLDLPGFLGDLFRTSKACGRAGVRGRRHHAPSARSLAAADTVSARISAWAAVGAVRVTAGVVSSVGYVAGAAAARLTPDSVHVRLAGGGGVHQCARRLRWYPFDEELLSVPRGPQVTSVGG